MNWNNFNRHGKLNVIYRALDVYNFPDEFSYENKVKSIRILLENQNVPLKNIPTPAKLYEMILNIYTYLSLHENEPNCNFLLHEITDISIQVGWILPDINHEIYNQYENVHKKKDKESVLLNIVSDSQNVHNSKINKNIKNIANKLVKAYPPSFQDWEECIKNLQNHITLTNKMKISIKRIKNSEAHFNIHITLKEIFISLSNYIENQESKEVKLNLYKRLSEELEEMSNKCLSGHLSRLINVLQGFDLNYTINFDSPSKIIYHDITRELQNSSESIKENILSPNKEVFDFINNLKLKNKIKWEKLTSKEDIDNICKKFLNI